MNRKPFHYRLCSLCVIFIYCCTLIAPYPSYARDTKIPVEEALPPIERLLSIAENYRTIYKNHYQDGSLLQKKITEKEIVLSEREDEPVRLQNLPEWSAELAALWQRIDDLFFAYHIDALKHSIAVVKARGYARLSEVSYLNAQMSSKHNGFQDHMLQLSSFMRIKVDDFVREAEDLYYASERDPAENAHLEMMRAEREAMWAAHAAATGQGDPLERIINAKAFSPIDGEVPDPPPCCELIDEHVIFPYLKKDFIAAPQQEALNSPAIGANNVFLHDGSFFEQSEDLFVRSVGMDFNFVRTYRSNVKTKGGGLIGSKWDFNYNKRLFPLGGVITEQGYKKESINDHGDMLYFNGAGRVEKFKHKESGHENVSILTGTFKAYVSRYESPPGLFGELARYVITAGSLPFEHSNVEGKIFYELRLKDGFREIYNCRGQLIYLKDRNDNSMQFTYDGERINPLTYSPYLESITDTAGRTYTLEYEEASNKERGVFTNYQGEPLEDKYLPMRLKFLNDFDGRKVEFNYADSGSGHQLRQAFLIADGTEVAYAYEYDDDDLITTITFPREYAQNGPPALINKWDKSDEDKFKVVGQSIKGEGIDQEVTIQSGESAYVTDVSGLKTTYQLSKMEDTYVVSKIEYPLDGGGKAVTSLEYNDDYQITNTIYPEGNGIRYTYDSSNEAVSVGDFKYANNLSKGNILTKEHYAGSKSNGLDYNTIPIVYEYENLFNQIKGIKGPGAAVTKYTYEHGRRSSPGNNGNPLKITSPTRTLGGNIDSLSDITLSFTYHKNGLTATSQDAEGFVTESSYDQNGYLTSILYPDQNSVSYGHDARGNVIEITDKSGYVTSFKVNQRNLVEEQILNASGVPSRTVYEYDLNENLVKETVFVKDTFSEIPQLSGIASQGMKEIVFDYKYNLRNQITQKSETSGEEAKITKFHYDNSGHLVRVDSPLATNGQDENHNVEMKYNPQGLLKEIITGGNDQQRTNLVYTYDKNGNVVAQTDSASGAVTQFITDGFDRDFKKTLPNGTVELTPLNPDGSVAYQEIKGKNHQGTNVTLMREDYTYDELGSLNQTKQFLFGPDGRKQAEIVTKLIRNKDGDVVKIVHPNLERTIIDYSYHKKIAETDALGNKIVYDYDASGNLSSIKEIEKEVTYHYRNGEREKEETTKTYHRRMFYDAFGRVTSMIDPAGNETYYGYDSLGTLRAMVKPNIRTDIFETDHFGRVTKETQFANIEDEEIITTKKYDINDRLIETTNFIGPNKMGHTKYAYGSNNLVTSSTKDDHPAHTYEYDHSGNLIKEVTPNEITITRNYDLANRVTDATIVYDNTYAQHGSKKDTFVYDGLDRIVQAKRYNGMVQNDLTYNSLNKVVSDKQTVKNKSFEITYKYDEHGRKLQTGIPELPTILHRGYTYKYDELSRLTKIVNTTRTGVPEELSYEYSGPTRVALRTIDNKFQTFLQYDKNKNLVGMQIYDPSEGKSIWDGYAKYNIDNLNNETGYSARTQPIVQKSNSIGFVYTPTQQTRTMRITSASMNAKELKHNAKSVIRTNEMEDGRLARTYNYTESLSQEPGTILGMNVTTAVNGNKIAYTYEKDQIKKVDFHTYGDIKPGLEDVFKDLLKKFGELQQDWVGTSFALFISDNLEPAFHNMEAGLTVNGIKEAMRGDGDKVVTNEFKYDGNANMTQDARYWYSLDYKNRLSKAKDTWRFTRQWEEEIFYYYDFLNRLVYLEHTPAEKKGVQVYRDNLRLLYDQYLPYAEVKTDAEGKPVDLLAYYTTHPRGLDVGRMILLSQEEPEKEMRNPDTKEQVEYLPFFDINGELVMGADRDGIMHDTNYRYEARQRPARLKHVFMDQPGKKRVEVPLISLRTRWDSFSGLSVVIPEGKFIFDTSRNLHQEWDDLIDEVQAAVTEDITAAHKVGMAAMGIAMLPIFLIAAPYATVVMAGGGLIADYGLTTYIMKKEYTMEDALGSVAMDFFSGPLPADEAIKIMLKQSLGITHNFKVSRSMVSRMFGRGSRRMAWKLKKGFENGRILDEVIEVGRGAKIYRYRGVTDAEAAMGKEALAHHIAEQGVMAKARVKSTNEGKYRALLKGGIPKERARELMKTGQMCFVAGTPVLMADGSLKAIEQVEVGDKVMTRNESSPELFTRNVSALSVRNVDALINVHIQSNQGAQRAPPLQRKTVGSTSSDDDSHIITTTEEHPFWVKDQGWTEAARLKVGDTLLLATEHTATITNITQTQSPQTLVYNFTVDDSHTYFVGDAKVWVHNRCYKKIRSHADHVAAKKNKKQYAYIFEMVLDPSDWVASRSVHFNRANAALEEAMRKSPKLAALIKQVIPSAANRISSKGGRKTPKWWTWEHVHSSKAGGRKGVMRLVPRYQHRSGSDWWKLLHIKDPIGGFSGGYAEWGKL